MIEEYFSDREGELKPRVKEELPLNVWKGIIAIFSRMMGDGSFGKAFPQLCFHGPICGYDKSLFLDTLKAEIPDIVWPLTADKKPPLFTMLDFIEFCYKYAAKPQIIEYHSLEQHNFINSLSTLSGFSHLFRDEPEPGHYHFSYNIEDGQEEFREAINRIFARNGIIYEVTEAGSIIRLAPVGLREQLQQTIFYTRDSDLDTLLNSARMKFLDPDIDIRKESLEKLWDDWERLKTIEAPNKKTSMGILLEKTSVEVYFREIINDEATSLTEIGNKFRIRHSETTKIPIESSDHVDYLFSRLFSLIYLLLKATNRVK